MDYNEFKMTITEEIMQKVKNGACVSINNITKNNGVCLQGLTISGHMRTVSPTIYLNDFYKDYQNGKEVEKIVEEILNIYENSKADEMDIDFFMDFCKVRENLVYKLVNYEKNIELLNQIPHVRYLDLAIVFYCLIQNEQIENGSILIYNNHLKMWDVSMQEIYNIAIDNTPRILKSDIRSMEEIMEELFDGIKEKDVTQIGCAKQKENEKSIKEELGMYVLSNNERMNGAACILYDKVLENFAELKNKDFYILPSSVHEVILVPEGLSIEKEQLESMVREVNETQVEEQEVLSNHVYFYSRKKKMVACL